MKLKRTLCLFLAISMSLSLMISVAAIDVDVEEGISVGVNQGVILPTEEEVQASEAKAKDMSRLVYLLGLSDTSSMTRSALNEQLDEESAIKEINEILARYNAEYTPVTSLSPLLRAVATTKTLSMTAVAQSNTYYCGPASAYMVLKTEGKNVTQSGLAGTTTTYLKTTSAGTDFGTNWTTTLNSYSSHTYNLMWGNPSDTTARAIEMTDAAIGTLASGYGVVYDTIQYSGTSTNRLVGYSSTLTSSIYHYVAGYGYNATDSSNRVCYYIDPNDGNASAYGKQTIGFRLMCTLIKDRGLVY